MVWGALGVQVPLLCRTKQEICVEFLVLAVSWTLNPKP